MSLAGPDFWINGIGLVLTGSAFLRAKVMEPLLPDPVPTHWNWRGQVDGWLRKPLGTYVLPLVMAILQGVFAVSRWSLPADRASEALLLGWIQCSTSIFLLYVTEMALRAGAGQPIRMIHGILPAAVLFLLALMGGIVFFQPR